jgi:RNA polymerase sigma-70 factor (ECF subfamily)
VEAGVTNAEQDLRRVGEILETHRTMLTAYLVHLTHDSHAAEDLVQEVYQEVLSNAGLAMRGDDLGAYLRGIGRHLASRLFRKAKPGPLTAQCLESAWDEPGAREGLLDSARAALRLCVDSLQATARRMFELRYQQGRPYAQIAHDIEMTSAAVRMSLTRIRRQLAECVRSRMGEAWEG